MGVVAADDNVIALPLNVRVAVSEAEKANAEMAKRVADLLLVPGKDIPSAMFDFIVGHALAHTRRSAADDAVRDAWERAQNVKTATAEAREAAAQDLEAARRDQRNARHEELLAIGALECIRARITLIDASHRRASDVAAIAGKTSR